MDIFSHIQKLPNLTPDDRAMRGTFGMSPICDRCNRHASDRNPIGFTLRRGWNPLDKNPRAAIDALCAECREKYGS